MRLCANVPGQYAIQTALGGYQSINDLILPGGRLFKHSVVSVGATAIEAIGRVRSDIFFMGVTGVHQDAGLTTGDAEDAAVKRAISRQSGETVILASSEKVGAASPFLVIPLAEADMLISDGPLSQELQDACVAAAISVFNSNRSQPS